MVTAITDGAWLDGSIEQHRLITLGTARAAGHTQLVVLHAHSLNAAQEAIQNVRDNSTVVLNCDGLSQPLAQRLLDVVRGGLCALDGRLTPIGADVVLLQPAISRSVC
ncbi:MAG: cell division protein SepF [Cyanobacteria bacterium K_DeepCast_35m_m2_023]|nr:cell division protein SepF [Cyanobacteria bacterium K_DeepCast_35m_m2_023]